ncbi:MAG TPA: gliding motility-associated C-terminal domain-containing protein, partial [Chitinophagales bacterium]|nr:gliding motility-associated C-terminal domain-containing protein [Chitinophagales bacterium]
GFIVTGSAGGQALLMKVDAVGAITWNYKFIPQSGASAYGNKVIQTSDGGYLVAGSASELGAGRDSSKLFAFKTDASGTLSWAKVFIVNTGFDDDDYLSDVVETADGYVFVGYATMVAGDGQSDAVVVKTDKTGGFQWARRFGNSNSEDVESIISDGGNSIVMSGLDNLGAYIYNWSAPNSGPTVIGTNTRYYSTGLPVTAGNLTKTTDNNFALFASGATFGNFTSILAKADRNTGAVLFAKSYNSFISLLPTGIQAADSGFLINSISADTTGSGGAYDFGVTKTDINGNQGGSGCPASNVTILTQAYNPTVNTFTPTLITTGTRSSGGVTASNFTPTTVIACRSIACVAPPTPTVTSTGNNTCSGTQVTINASGGTNVTYRVYTVANNGTSIGTTPLNVSPTTTTTYYVEADDNNNPGCVSSRGSVTVTVIQPPANVGAITGSATPCIGSSSYSIGAVSGATSYSWSVSGGGTVTSSGTSATINWTQAGGPYTITVSATNSCGTKTATLDVNVLANVANVNATATPNPACAGGTLTLSGSGTNVTTWSWSGPLGFTASTQNTTRPNLLTTHTGAYTLTASNACNSLTSTVNVTVNDAPRSVTASATPNPACAGNTISLSGSALDATSYSWTGPNSFTASSQNPVIANAQSNATGTYTLTATNACGSTPATVNVTVNDIPLSVTTTANGANPNSVCPGGTLNLSGSATGATSYAWSGPNSFTSTQINNTINNFQQVNVGTYTLVATNSCGTAQSTVNVTISSGPVNTTATANLTNICSQATLNLTGTSTGATSYSWSGPNGFTSNLQNPTKPVVTMADSGLYTLVATNICGTASATVNVDVDTALGVVSVNAQPNDTICAGGTITLNGSGTQVNTWAWSGPSGYTSSQQSPVINNATAANSGAYTLTASNACGNATVTVNVLVNTAIQNFGASATANGVVCSGAGITFSATGTNVNGWSWNGPNGFTSTQQNPVINPATTINSGTYTLTAFNACGNQTATVVVQVDTTIENVTANASPNDTVCSGATLNFSGSGTNVTTWSWTGPNFTSALQNPSIPNATTANSGTYTLTATNACGNQTSTLAVLVSDAIANLTASAASGNTICNTGTISLTAGGAGITGFSWTGPNGFTSNQQNPTITNATVAASGTYTVTANNSCGTQTATVAIQVDTLIETLTTSAAPDDTVCAGGSINLQVTTTGDSANTYVWTGPNGFTSSVRNPVVTPATAANSGDYIVTGTNACGSQTDTVTVRVNNIPLKPASPNGPLSPCGNDTTTYNIPAVPDANSYTWTLSGGGTVISGQGTTSIDVSWGSTAGTYTLGVTAANNCGVSAPAEVTITLGASIPVMNSVIAGDTGVCPGIEIYSISNIPNATGYTWTVDAGGTIASGQGSNSVNINWTTPGVHTVSVTATNSCGNSAPATLAVNVHQAPTAPTVNLQNNTTTICEGITATITATNSTGGASISYNFYDAANGGNLVGTSPLTVSPTVTTIYYLEVINEFGCTNSGGRIPVTVNVTGAPTVQSITGDSAAVCYNSAATLTANATPQGSTSITWWDAASGGNQLASGNTYTIDPVTQTTVVYAQATSTSGCQNLQGRVAATVVMIPRIVTDTLSSDKPNNIIFPNEVINFTAVPDSFANYEFFWNGTSVQNGTSPTWGSSKIQDQDSVWVIASDNGCNSDRNQVIVTVVDFPNAFTPNNDRVNDVFLDGYDLVITNRWGQTLYQGRDGWDGRYKGDKVSPGTYYYIVMLDNITDRKNAIKGTVLLVEE